MLNFREVMASVGLARQHTNSAAMTLDIVRPMHHAEFSPNYPKAKPRNDKQKTMMGGKRSMIPSMEEIPRPTT